MPVHAPYRHVYGVQTRAKHKTLIYFNTDIQYSNFRGRRLPIPNIPGDEWKNRSIRGEKTLVGCSANPVILILMRVSLPSKLTKTKQTKINKQKLIKRERERERERRTPTLSHNRTCV